MTDDWTRTTILRVCHTDMQYAYQTILRDVRVCHADIIDRLTDRDPNHGIPYDIDTMSWARSMQRLTLLRDLSRAFLIYS